MSARGQERTPAENRVWVQFMEGAYQAVGVCQNPGCESPDAIVMTAGRAPSARVCLVCFEFEFDCKHPTRRRLESRRTR